ncbi:ATP-binding protein, partial [Desulfobacterales bacterium HSG16]|nr:ATP-binding protein [Desulfobacterales bacterium HSG16]
ADEEIKKFRTIFDKAVHGNAIADLEGNIIYINDYFADTHGYDTDELIGQHLSIFHTHRQMKDVKQINESMLEKGSYDPIEVWHIHKDGTEFPMLMSGIIITDDNGNPEFMAATAIDISDRKNMESCLRQAQKMESIGSLAGGIAHDFNNILYPIIGLSEMLLEDLPSDSLEYENARVIFKAGQRGSDLVRQILAFSRQSENEITPVRVQNVLHEVLKLCRSTIPVNIEITHNIQPNCRLIMADPTQIHQIAMNLITNAYHAVEKTCGKISVKLKEANLESDDIEDIFSESGHYAMISISDTGCGIDPVRMDKIFDPYFTTKEKDKGTGLGLAVVYGIVKEHQGDIKVYSDLGKGTTFNVYLPLVGNHADVAVKKIETSQAGSERILLVDDEEAIVRLEKQMLERLGYQVTSRINSVEAFEAFKAKPNEFDLVITDMTMPYMTGDQLARKLISIKPDLPIIICTGFSEELSLNRIDTIGIKGLLMKPVVKSEMAQIVRKVLDETNGLDQE